MGIDVIDTLVRKRAWPGEAPGRATRHAQDAAFRRSRQRARITKHGGWASIAQAERESGRILTLTVARTEKLRESTPAWEEAKRKLRNSWAETVRVT